MTFPQKDQRDIKYSLLFFLNSILHFIYSKVQYESAEAAGPSYLVTQLLAPPSCEFLRLRNPSHCSNYCHITLQKGRLKLLGSAVGFNI